MKEKTVKVHFKTRNFCSSKDTVKKIQIRKKKYLQYLQSRLSDEELVSGIYYRTFTFQEQ